MAPAPVEKSTTTSARSPGIRESDRRGTGAGRALIEHVVERGRREGWNRVYWLTKHDNETARRLYESIVPADGFIRYRVML